MPVLLSPAESTPTEKTLAGQPQEPPWQSYPPAAAEQDSYSYPPPPSSSSGQGYGQSSYGQQAGQGYPGPSYTPADQGGYQAAGAQDTYLGSQDQAYPGAQDQGYPGPQDQGYPGPQDQGYPGPQDQGYPGPQGQPTPQWQGAPGQYSAAKAKGDAKGFLGALFDFSFTSFVTPKVVKVLYVLITVWTVLWALIFLRYGFKYGGAAGGFFTLLVVDPILILLTLGAYRVVLELFMVVHRIHEDLKAIRERGDRT
jgi:Domain of unknown function (DUF4282)